MAWTSWLIQLERRSTQEVLSPGSWNFDMLGLSKGSELPSFEVMGERVLLCSQHRSYPKFERVALKIGI